jgi:hypothetical protein
MPRHKAQARLSVLLFAALSLRPAFGFNGEDAAIRSACPQFAAWQDQQRALHQAGAANTATSAKPVVVSKPALREELLRMADEDQAARRDMPPNPNESQIDKLLKTDARNLARIKAIVKRWGFPLNTLVGDDGVAAAFLLVQHASDKAFQAQVLRQLAPRVKTGHIGGDQFALLTDRVLVEQGKPQIYGTQLKGVEAGELELAPIDAPQKVDQRRRQMGMPPLADYLCVVKAAYAAPSPENNAR